VILAGARFVRDEVIVVPPLDDAIVEVRRAPALVKQWAGE
jgi:hypothetical protein